MELAFTKHFTDSTNLLLMMDHDSGYVEGTVEGYTSSHESDHSKDIRHYVRPCGEPENLYLSEDALLETPEIFLNPANLQNEIDNEDYEETRRLFFSPERVISSSVKSQDSTVVYSGLENDSSSDLSTEITIGLPITIGNKDIQNISMENEGANLSTTSCSDMSLDMAQYNPVILERQESYSEIAYNCHLMTPIKFSPKCSKINETFECKNNQAESIHNIGSLNLDSKVKYDNLQFTSNKELSEINNRKEKSTLIEENNGNSQKTDDIELPSGSIGAPLNIVTNIFEVPKEKKRLTLVFSKSDKENGYRVKRKYPSMTPEKKYETPVNPNVSPDIFDDEVPDHKVNYFDAMSKETTQLVLPQTQFEERYINKLDQKLLKRTQKGMSGVLPPPSVTVVQLSAADILSKLEANRNYFWNNDTVIERADSEEVKDSSLNSSSGSSGYSKSLLVNVQSANLIVNSKWPEILNFRYHGLHFNRSKISEEIEDLCEKYAKRCIGAETQSTCTVFEVQSMKSPRRKVAKPRWGQKSPGRRLSHLARRRITFSSATLQAGGSSALAGSRARQILVDAKKIDLLSRRKSPRKTPKKTPSKSPKVKTRTPSSSAKKKLAIRFRKLTGEFEKSLPSTSEMSSAHRALFKSPDKSARSGKSHGITNSTKRALFQSPDRDTKSSLFNSSKSQDVSSSENERSQLRRALFTSPRKTSPIKGKKSPFKQALRFGPEKKRKRSESDDMQPLKFPRSMSMDIRSNAAESSRPLNRTQSELNISLNRSQSQMELSDPHKKKLHWAVYGALQSQNVFHGHPQFKVFASVLARVTRRFYTSQMASGSLGTRPEGGTTERMYRIARHHVIPVIKGKSADDIVAEYLKSRTKVQKPQGYVRPEDYNNFKVTSTGKENVFQDRANTIESWEKNKLEQLSKPTNENKIERIRKVINFGDDR